MGILANREDPDKMQHNAAFRLLRLKQSSEKAIQFYPEINDNM